MKIKKILKATSILLLIISIFIILGAVFYAFLITKDVKLDKSKLLTEATSKTEILAIDQSVIPIQAVSKEFVPYEEIDVNTVNAFVSLEDKRFFKHKGIDYIRTIGASISNIKAGYFKEGGSTITQQLVKNSLLSSEKTIERKLKEAKLSFEVEKNFTKEEIMETYLNTIYFGHSLYGIYSASNRLFQKEPKDLTIAESAMLAGIINNPLQNSPLNSIDNALKRRNLVLKLMLEQGYLNESQYEYALKENYEIPHSLVEKTTNMPYIQVVIEECANLLGVTEKEILTNGYKIYTYFDKNQQEILNNAFKATSLDVENAEKTYILADNLSGGVSAYISSINYSPYYFRRQSASTLKPLVSYLPALEQGLILPSSPILDERTSIKGYNPSNYKDVYQGWITVKESLSKSSNACSLKLLDSSGKTSAIRLLNDFGLEISDSEGYALALGASKYGQTPMELLGAYLTLANYGKGQELSFIKEVYDANDKLVYRHNNVKKHVVSAENAYFITDMLIECANNGTAKKLNQLPFQVASKTGTNGDSNGNYDAWNISYTTKNTLLTWYGSRNYKEYLPLSITGGAQPTIVAKYILSNLPTPNDFEIPSSLEYAEIDNYIFENYHLLSFANENTPKEYKKYVLVSENVNIPTSSYFDDALPTDFNVTLGDGEVIINLTKNEKFDYEIKNSHGETVFKIKKGFGKSETAIPKPFGRLIEFYSVVAVTEDGIIVDKSPPKTVLVW